MGAVIAGAALYGYARKQGWKIPQIPFLPPAASAAFILWALGHWGDSLGLAPSTRQNLKLAALGPASISAFSWGEEGTLSGDDVVGGHGVVYD